MNPNIDDLIPFKDMKNINKAKDIFVDGINKKKRFTINFDVDTDGCTAGSIIYRYLREFTDKVDWTINIGKSHGLLSQDLSQYEETDILIIVDSLDSTDEKYIQLFNMGIQIIILDHHDIEIDINTEYFTLVSSANDYMNPSLSGAGVVWKFCSYLDEFYCTSYAEDLADLAACGIIADMCDVSEGSMENRYICSIGLNNQVNAGIKKINGSYPFNSQSVSFGIAPLVNAACRVKQNILAAQLFLSDDKKEIGKIIKELKLFKEQQNSEIRSLMPNILNQADSQINNKAIYIFIDTESDVAGLIGNKLLEVYKRPLFIIRKKEEIDEDGVILRSYYGGSMRAIGIPEFRSLINDSGLCSANGHQTASGFEVDIDNFEQFTNFTENLLKDIEIKITIDIDAQINLNDVSSKLIDKIKQLDKITGEGFKPIKFLIQEVDEYVQGSMSDGKHLKISSPTIDFIKWNFNGDFESFDNCIYSPSIEFIGSLDSGFFGRTFRLKMILDTYKIHNGYDDFGGE